jgi:hypothetical protein
MSTLYVVGCLSNSLHKDDFVVFISDTLQGAIDYYMKIDNKCNRLYSKYIVKTEINKEITDGVCNEETVMCRYFSVSDKELKEERAKLHKKMVRFTDERLGLDDEISVLKKRIYEIDVNLGVCLFDDFGV